MSTFTDPQIAALEKTARQAGDAFTRAVCAYRAAAGDVLITQLAALFDAHPKLSAVGFTTSSEYDDQGSYFTALSPSCETAHDASDQQDDNALLAWENIVYATDNEVVFEVFATEYDGQLTRRQVAEKAAELAGRLGGR